MWQIFETITDLFRLKQPEEREGKPLNSRVWVWGVMSIEDKLEKMTYGKSIQSFVNHIEKNKGTYYFHNLKFDGWFIVDYLLKNGWTHDTKRLERTFRCNISDQRQWFEIEIIYKRYGRKLVKTVIRDSLKKLPFSVAKIGTDFDVGVEKIAWSQQDYTTYRPLGHQPTAGELEYLEHDLLVMKRALAIQFEQGLDRMTVSGDALSHFKDSIGGKKPFDYKFPQLTIAEDNDIRQTYRGGFCFITPKARGKEFEKGIVFDVNSLYPSVMYDRILPVGDPVFFEGKYDRDMTHPLYIQKFVCEYELKDNYLPTIQTKNSSRSLADYSTSSEGEPEILTLTSVDLKLFFEHYNVTSVEYINGYKFQAESGIFKKYIDKWTYMKNNFSGAPKAIAKLMLNGLYGKFGTNPEQIPRIPELNEEKGTVILGKGDADFGDTVYIPMASFITAYAREVTIRTGQKVYNRLLYCDTDSIHLTGHDIPDEIKDIVSKDKLGEWKLEYRFDRAKFLRPKRYMEQISAVGYQFIKTPKDSPTPKIDKTRLKLNRYNGLMVIKCGGLNDRLKNDLTWQEFNIGYETNERLTPLVVSGGVALIPGNFKMRN